MLQLLGLLRFLKNVLQQLFVVVRAFGISLGPSLSVPEELEKLEQKGNPSLDAETC